MMQKKLVLTDENNPRIVFCSVNEDSKTINTRNKIYPVTEDAIAAVFGYYMKQNGEFNETGIYGYSTSFDGKDARFVIYDSNKYELVNKE